MSSYVFLGAPGAGKGTMADLLCEKCGQVHISTGDLLRAEMKSGTELGRKAKAYVDGGTLVPDEVVAAMVGARLRQADVKTRGFILDGYPRTVRQAELLDEALVEIDLTLDGVVLFEIDSELVMQRLTARRLCRNCGAIYNVLYNPAKTDGVCDRCHGPLYQRADDTVETARGRLQVYEKETMPLIAFYEKRGQLLRTTGAEEKNRNFALMCETLGI